MNKDRLRNALDRAGLSQVGAASLFGYNDRPVRRWISGEMRVPRVVQIPTHSGLPRRSPPRRRAAEQQEIPGHTEIIEYEDDKGKWHTETASVRDRPHTVVKDMD